MCPLLGLFLPIGTKKRHKRTLKIDKSVPTNFLCLKTNFYHCYLQPLWCGKVKKVSSEKPGFHTKIQPSGSAKTVTRYSGQRFRSYTWRQTSYKRCVTSRGGACRAHLWQMDDTHGCRHNGWRKGRKLSGRTSASKGWAEEQEDNQWIKQFPGGF